MSASYMEIKKKHPFWYALAAIGDAAVIGYTAYLMGKYLATDTDMFLKAMMANGIWCISTQLVRIQEKCGL